jgi:hypothetical protein
LAQHAAGSEPERFPSADIEQHACDAGGWPIVRKLIAFDDDTFDKLKQLARDRMANFQELADEAFGDLLRKHGIPIDLKDALRKSAAVGRTPVKDHARSRASRKTRS